MVPEVFSKKEDAIVRLNFLAKQFAESNKFDIEDAKGDFAKCASLGDETCFFELEIFELEIDKNVVQNTINEDNEDNEDKYYFPVKCFKYDSEEDWEEEVDPINYTNTIKMALEKEQYDHNIVEALDPAWAGNKEMCTSVRNKLISAKWDVEEINNTLYGVVIVSRTENFTPAEENYFINWIEGQNSDGFGEGFSQRDIKTSSGGELHVCFWDSSGNWTPFKRNF